MPLQKQQQDRATGQSSRTEQQQDRAATGRPEQQARTPGHCTRTLQQDPATGQSTRTQQQDTSPGHSNRTEHQDTATEHSTRTQQQDRAPGHSNRTEHQDTATGQSEYLGAGSPLCGKQSWCTAVQVTVTELMNRNVGPPPPPQPPPLQPPTFFGVCSWSLASPSAGTTCTSFFSNRPLRSSAVNMSQSPTHSIHQSISKHILCIRILCTQPHFLFLSFFPSKQAAVLLC